MLRGNPVASTSEQEEQQAKPNEGQRYLRYARYIEPVTYEQFSERGYLGANPDVAAAVRAGTILSGKAHFEAIGHTEARQQRNRDNIEALKREKIARIRPLMNR
jgi:hypothetical protein